MLVLLQLHVVGFWHKLFNPVITAVVKLGGVMSGAQGVLEKDYPLNVVLISLR